MSKTLKSVDVSETDGPKSNRTIEGIVIGTFTGRDDSGTALVDIPGHPEAQTLSARATVSLGEAAIGRDVALMFEGGDLLKPIVIGLIQVPDRTSPETAPPAAYEKRDPVHVEVDGERLTFTAEKEIVLRCGKASITLTRAGKVLIKGEYLLNRSSGVNRIKGGTVQIN